MQTYIHPYSQLLLVERRDRSTSATNHISSNKRVQIGNPPEEGSRDSVLTIEGEPGTTYIHHSSSVGRGAIAPAPTPLRQRLRLIFVFFFLRSFLPPITFYLFASAYFDNQARIFFCFHSHQLFNIFFIKITDFFSHFDPF